MPQAVHLQQLAAAGYTTVLDVSAPEEPRGFDEPATAAAVGLSYINLAVRSYQPPAEIFERVRALLCDAGQRPMLFHCRSANRVGGLLLPYLMLDEGKSQGEALQIAMQVGLRSPELAETALRYVASQGGTVSGL
jgi:protein tyrosine phosphatase (PTP) superfamily phosphohydrolase (DUF442 family)